MRDLSGAVPSSVQVVFRVRKCQGDPNDPPPPRIYLVTIQPTGGATGFQGYPGAKVFHTEVVAAWDTTPGAVNPTNGPELQALANRIAVDFYDYRAVNYDRVYNGALNVQPDGYADEILVTYGLGRDGQPALSTRLRGRPITGEPEELSHAGTTCCDKQGVVLYAAPIVVLGPGKFRLHKVGLQLVKGHLTGCDLGDDDIDACPAETAPAPGTTPPPTDTTTTPPSGSTGTPA